MERDLAAVVLASRRGLTGFRPADLTAIGALAGLTLDATVFVRASDTTGAAVRKDLTGCEEGRRDYSEDDFHNIIIMAHNRARSSDFDAVRVLSALWPTISSRLWPWSRWPS